MSIQKGQPIRIAARMQARDFSAAGTERAASCAMCIAPTPRSRRGWWALPPVGLLVSADPFYAGVIAPVLLVAVPCALAVALAVALGRNGG